MTHYRAVMERTWNENILFSALIELTYRCNLKCVYCYNDLNLKGEPLSTAQYFAFLDDLREIGTMNVTLTGGEPLAHPDFFAIGHKAKELGFVVRIKSNGHALRGALAVRLKTQIDPFQIDISLHGARASTHDRQTRVEGSFDRLIANIPLLLDRGFRLKLNCTLTRWNEEEIDEIFGLADQLGLNLSFSPSVSPRDNGDQEPLRLEASRKAKQYLFEVQVRRARSRVARASDSGASESTRSGSAPVETRPQKNCGAGSSGIAVDPYGNVLPCVQWRRPIGNLHRQSIKEIWKDVGETREVRRLTLAAGAMVDNYGPTGRLMGFCPGLAQNYNGDPLTIYPEAHEQMSMLREKSK